MLPARLCVKYGLCEFKLDAVKNGVDEGSAEPVEQSLTWGEKENVALGVGGLLELADAQGVERLVGDGVLDDCPHCVAEEVVENKILAETETVEVVSTVAEPERQARGEFVCPGLVEEIAVLEIPPEAVPETDAPLLLLKLGREEGEGGGVRLAVEQALADDVAAKDREKALDNEPEAEGEEGGLAVFKDVEDGVDDEMPDWVSELREDSEKAPDKLPVCVTVGRAVELATAVRLANKGLLSVGSRVGDELIEGLADAVELAEGARVIVSGAEPEEVTLKPAVVVREADDEGNEDVVAEPGVVSDWSEEAELVTSMLGVTRLERLVQGEALLDEV
jgi:hypothetical protein